MSKVIAMPLKIMSKPEICYSLQDVFCDELDELIAFLGLIRTRVEIYEYRPAVVATLGKLQSLLFSISDNKSEFSISSEDIEALRIKISDVVSGLPDTKETILPGGSDLNAFFHLAKVKCSKAIKTHLRLHIAESTNLEFLMLIKEYLVALSRYFMLIGDKKEYIKN